MNDIEGIPPHGGKLIERVLHAEEREAARDKARHLPQITLGPMSLADLEMLAIGAMSPLTGFMTRADYECVVAEMRLADGTVWSIPVTLPVSTEVASGIREGQEVALVEGDGHILFWLYTLSISFAIISLLKELSTVFLPSAPNDLRNL